MEKRHFTLRDLVRARKPEDRKNYPEPLLPISETSFKAYIKAGYFPEPKKIGNRVYWLAEDVKSILRKLDRGELAGINVHAEESQAATAEA
jgi:predicted DNA-binding transcriptional regulator AlpA